MPALILQNGIEKFWKINYYLKCMQLFPSYFNKYPFFQRNNEAK